ncbi:MAG: hypothetical protein H7A20_03215 [Rhodanobacteraceae bacterium]|mgnify:CR=1 FL=1|nr:hypothetical protein [Xanthomonadales bacterium]MCP5477793.1 hypothetical protein [Rhodanobacteraceae bacterium]HPF73056.1 hypothetical protein [Xanthomonadaceae bacterium]HRX99607.1 hypothetical protein [Xanthomonadaceae bacterium]
MRFITRFYEMTRPLALTRQAREVAKLIDSMNRKEQLELALLAQQEIDRGPQPSNTSDPDRPWGDAAEQALGRARSTVPQLRNRGLAVWLATVFHETQGSQQGSMNGVHREVLGFLGRLKGTYGSAARRATTMAS